MRDDHDAIRRAVAGKRVGGSGWIRGNCPMCLVRTGKQDRKGALGVNMAGFFKCFKCGAAGRLDGSRVTDAWVPDAQEQSTIPRTLLPPESFTKLFDDGAVEHSKTFGVYRSYVLYGRKIPREVAVEAHIGACTRGAFAGRVVVPVLSETGAWLWYVGRTTWAAERTYLYPSGNRNGVLYNASALYVETDEPVLVVEGVFDALAHWPNAVAVLGKPTDAHVLAFASASRPVCVMLDGDAPEDGLAFAHALYQEGKTDVGVVQLAPTQDPDEISREDASRLARDAVSTTPREGAVRA